MWFRRPLILTLLKQVFINEILKKNDFVNESRRVYFVRLNCSVIFRNFRVTFEILETLGFVIKFMKGFGLFYKFQKL